MDEPTSVAGQVLSFYERGWSKKEICLELKLTKGRVDGIIRKASSRSLDSQRIFACQELLLEAVAILREIRGLKPEVIAKRMAGIEKRDLPRMVGAGIDRLSQSS